MRPQVLAAVLTLTAGGLVAAAPEAPRFAFPIDCVTGRTCEIQNYVDRDPGPGVLDYRCQHRTYQGHDGVDIRIPDMAAQARGVTVLAAAPGRVANVRDGVADVSVRKIGEAAVNGIGCGNAVSIDHGGGWISGYCHMAKGSVRVKPGDVVATGQPLGRVGLSGLTEFPHLHFVVRHDGKVVDPFAPGPISPGACSPQAGMWTPQAAREMAYKAGAILNIGLSGVAVTAESLEAGGVPAATAASPVMAVYGRVIGAQAGDEIEATLTGPGGTVLATRRLAPLPRDQAQYFYMVGRKRPATGWAKGAYAGDFRVWRGGQAVMARRVAVTF